MQEAAGERSEVTGAPANEEPAGEQQSQQDMRKEMSKYIHCCHTANVSTRLEEVSESSDDKTRPEHTRKEGAASMREIE